MFPRFSQLASRIRVPAGLVLAGIFLIFAKPTPGWLVLGSAVALMGLAVRAASAGYLEKNSSLAKNGPYAHTRNPLYFGSALAGAGFAIAGGRWWFLLLIALLFLLVYRPVIRAEEVRLNVLFGDEFASYARAVPLFWPSPASWRSGEAPRAFAWSRYKHNREYEALLAFCVIVAALWGRMLLTRL